MSRPLARGFFRRALAVLLVIGGLSSLTAADAFRDLSGVDAFAFGGIGVAGTRSPGETAFRQILARPPALAEFRRLLAKGNAPARCYALVAIHALDASAYEKAAAPFAKKDTPVTTIGGCMVTTLPMKSVIANITAGQYDRVVKPKP